MAPDLRAVFDFQRDDPEMIEARPDRDEKRVELVVGDEQDIEGLVRRVAERRPVDSGLSAEDLRVIANDQFCGRWDARSPRWPKWLDRRMHGDGPVLI